MARNGRVSDQVFASKVIELMTAGVTDRAMVATLVRSLPMKTRTAQSHLKKLREKGPPIGVVVVGAISAARPEGAHPSDVPFLKEHGVVPFGPNVLNLSGPEVKDFYAGKGLADFVQPHQIMDEQGLKKLQDTTKGCKTTGTATGRIQSSVPNPSNGPKEEKTTGPGDLLAAVEMSSEAALRLLETNVALLKCLRENVAPAPKEKPSEPLLGPVDVEARSLLHKALGTYGGFIHPKMSDGKWPGATGLCIKDLTHRVKDYVGANHWTDISAFKVIEAAVWLSSQCDKKYGGFDILVSQVQGLLGIRPQQDTTTQQ